MIPSPCLDMLYGKKSPLSMTERIRKVQELGFTAFEFWSWWDKNLDEIEQAMNKTPIKIGSFCTRPIPLVEQERRSEFRQGLKESIQNANRLGCKYLIGTTGKELPDVSRESQLQSIIDGLKSCAPMLEDAEVTLVIEPLNTKYNHPGYFLEKSDEAFYAIEQVGSPFVKILFDVYHQQISEGNLINNIRDNFDKIGYFHIADHPGRLEPGTGEICYPNVLQAIRDLGYEGYVGLEYKPDSNVELGLSRVRKLFHNE